MATVSRALADDPKIARATRAKVAQIAKEAGYVPDRAARRLRTGKTRVLALVMDPHPEIIGFTNALIQGLSQALMTTDYHLNVTPHFGNDNLLGPVEHIVDNRLADGLILTRTEPFDPRVRYLTERHVPFVTHGRTEFSQPHPFVDFDNERFAQEAAARLIDRGAQRICTILPDPRLTFHQHLKYGALRAIRAQGVTAIFPDAIDLDSSLVAIRTWAAQIGQTPDRPDGFICPGEASYLALTRGLQDVGLMPDQDYRVVVKTSSDLLQQIAPQIDTIFEDIVAAGRFMAEALLARIAAPETAPPTRVMSPAPQPRLTRP